MAKEMSLIKVTECELRPEAIMTAACHPCLFGKLLRQELGSGNEAVINKPHFGSAHVTKIK